MEPRDLLKKAKLVLNLVLYAGIAYALYLTYRQYQLGGLDSVINWFTSLPIEVLGVIVVIGAIVLAEGMSQW